jgi:hypothetical protein
LARRLRHARSVNVPSRLSSLGRMKALVSWAEHLAQALPPEFLPRRRAHVQGVAAPARSLAPVLGADADLLHGAAWPHDMAAGQQPVRPPPTVTAGSVASSKAQSYQRDPLGAG